MLAFLLATLLLATTKGTSTTQNLQKEIEELKQLAAKKEKALQDLLAQYPHLNSGGSFGRKENKAVSLSDAKTSSNGPPPEPFTAAGQLCEVSFIQWLPFEFLTWIFVFFWFRPAAKASMLSYDTSIPHDRAKA